MDETPKKKVITRTEVEEKLGVKLSDWHWNRLVRKMKLGKIAAMFRSNR